MDKTKIFYSSEIDYSKKTDEELVEIIKTGDKLAANYIIDRYKYEKEYVKDEYVYYARRINRII